MVPSFVLTYIDGMPNLMSSTDLFLKEQILELLAMVKVHLHPFT